MNESAQDLRRLQSALVLLLVFALCLYFPTLFHYTFADDDTYLAYSNRLLREAHWSDLYRLLLEPANAWEFLPVRDLTYWLDFRLYGDEPFGFHLTNLAWYLASCLSVWWLFRELVLFSNPEWRDKAAALALIGAVLFAIHPAHVEVVAWIASRKDLLAGTLTFLSLAFLVCGLRRGWHRSRLAWSVVFLVLACFSKAAAVTNLALIVLLIGSAGRSAPRPERRFPLLLVGIYTALVLFAVVVHFNVGQSSGIQLDNHPGLPAMLDRASRIQTGLIGILLFPYPLRFYHDVYQLGGWHWYVSVASLLLVVVAAITFLRIRALWAFGVLLMLVPMAIYLQVTPFTTWSLASERFVYVSVGGLALLFVDFFGRVARQKFMLLAFSVIVAACAAVVWQRVQEWELGYALLAREYERQPTFHNALRDQIVYSLLPQKGYDEAAVLARRIQRDYATDALLALVVAERAYREMSEAQSGVTGEAGENLESLQRGFCRAVSSLRSATLVGYRSMKSETDVSYNNILRTLDKLMRFRYADSKLLCEERPRG